MATTENTSSNGITSNASFWFRAVSDRNGKIVALAQAGQSWIETQSEDDRDLTAMHLFNAINDISSDVVVLNQLADAIKVAKGMSATTEDANSLNPPISIDVPRFLFDMNDIRVLAKAAQVIASEGDEECSDVAAILMRMVAERAQVLKNEIDNASTNASREGGAA